MGHRRKAREVALQVLYQMDISKMDVQEAIRLFWDNFEVPDNVNDFAIHLIEGTWNRIEGIDDVIRNCSENWSLERMAKVDKSILRMSVFELLYCDDIPPKVTLNEAIDLGKEYGSENSGSFINGILDALYAKMRTENGNQHILGVDRPAEK